MEATEFSRGRSSKNKKKRVSVRGVYEGLKELRRSVGVGTRTMNEVRSWINLSNKF